MRNGARILALVTDAFGGSGGIAQYNRDLFTALVSCDGVVGITVLPRLAKRPVHCPPGIVQYEPREGRFAYSLQALRCIGLPADIVFCGHLFMAPLAFLIARMKRAKLIVQLHGVEAWQRPKRLMRRTVEAADLVLCVSRYTRAHLLSWAAIAPERAVVLPNTIGEEFQPGDGDPLRASLGAEGKHVMLSVGRMSAAERYKGHDRIIAAIPELVRQGRDVLYIVVGDGDDVGRLRALARQTGVNDRVRFVGPVGRDELPSYYRIADLFVLPSTGEGFGIVFLEAMASGTPALGLAVGGALDALGNGELGRVVAEPDLVTALSQALAAPKGDPLQLARAVRDRFGFERFASQACSLVCRLMAKPMSAPPGQPVSVRS